MVMKKLITEKLLVNCGDEIVSVEINDIKFMEAIDGNIDIVMTDRRKYRSTKSLAECCRLINKKYIRRFCRKFALNLNHFNKYNLINSTLYLSEDIKIELSQRQEAGLKKLLDQSFIIL
jgi:DNA-binding LytR/AlgR family response regulator